MYECVELTYGGRSVRLHALYKRPTNGRITIVLSAKREAGKWVGSLCDLGIPLTSPLLRHSGDALLEFERAVKRTAMGYTWLAPCGFMNNVTIRDIDADFDPATALQDLRDRGLLSQDAFTILWQATVPFYKQQ